MSKRNIALAIAALAISSSMAYAQQGYIGLGAGESSTEVSGGGDKRDTAYKLFAGYDFQKNWGVEGGYADLGKPRYPQGEGKESAWFLAGRGILPVSNQFNVFGKLGATRNKLDLNGDKSRTDLLAGVGAEYNFNKQVGLRLEYEDFGKFGDDSTGKPRANMWSLGLTFKSF